MLGLELTLFWYKPSFFSYANHAEQKLVMLTKHMIYLYKASRFVSKQGHCSASLPLKGQATKQVTVNSAIEPVEQVVAFG